MNGIDELKKLKGAGFSDEEMGTWARDTRIKLSDNGFRQDEIDTYFGQPPFDPKPLVEHFNAQHQAATAPTTEGGTPTPVTDFMGALKAGFGESVTGLLTMGKPSATVAQDAPRASRIAGQIGTLAGDVPAMIGGFLAGGGPVSPVTGTAGAFALPAGMRKILMDKYENGEVTGWRDFFDRASGAFIDTAKGWITGAATGAAGKAVGLAPILSPTVKTAATLSAEVTTMVTVGKALEGQVPNADDFLDTALTLGFVKGSAKVAGKLRKIYAETGVKPDEVAQDAMKDPTIHHDLLSDDVVIPRAYGDSVADAIIKSRATRKGVERRPTGEYVDVRPVPSITDLAGNTVVPSVSDTSKTGAFYDPNAQGPVARVVPPYQERPAGSPSSVDLVTGKADLARKMEDETRVLEKNRMFRSAEEILQEHNFLKSAEDMIPQGDRPRLREKFYILPKGRGPVLTPEDMTEMRKGLGEMGIEIGEDAAPRWEQNASVTDAQASILSRIVQDDPVKEKLTLRALYTSIFDNLNPIRMALRDAGKEDLPTAENPYSLERLTRGTMGKGMEFLKTGAFSFNDYKTVTKGYEAILAPVKKDLDGFRAYMVAKRVIEKTSQGIETGFSVEEARTVVKDGAAKYQRIHEERLAYRDALVDYLIDSGIVNRADASRFRAANKDYVGFHKFFEEADGVTGQSSSRSVKNPIKKMEGGKEKITDPIIADIKDTFLFIGLAEKNAARQAFVALGEDFAQKVRAKSDPITKKEIAKIVQEFGVSEDAAQAIAAVRPSSFRTEANEIAVFTNGERDVYKVDPKVAEAFQDQDRISANFITGMLVHTPASLLRAGVIVTPEYITRNIMRDAVSSFIYAGSNPIKTAQGLASIVKGDTAYHNWLKGGGGNATMVAIDRDYVHNHIIDMDLESGWMRRSWNVAKAPIDVLRAASELVENATRIGTIRSEMLVAKDKAKIQALSMIAREATVDFARHGKDTQEFGKATAFFNPALQGIDRFGREMKENPLGTTAKAMAAVTLPAMLLWWANRGDEEIANLPAWQHYAFMMTRVPLPNGESFILRIPYAQEFGLIFGAAPTRLLEAFVNDNPDALKGMDEALLQAFTPSVIPTLAVPLISQATNQAPLGGPIIPADREKLLPEYQYTPYTTELTKAMGQLIGAFPGMERTAVYNQTPIGSMARALTSPALIENYVRSWTGGMGVYLLQLADKGLREAGVLPDPIKPAWDLADYPVIKAFVARYPSASAQSIRSFFEEYEGSKTYFDTFQFLAKGGDLKAEAFVMEHQEHMAQFTGIRTALTDHASYIRMILKNPEIPAEEQKQLIDTMYMRMIELSKSGLEGMRLVREANDISPGKR